MHNQAGNRKRDERDKPGMQQLPSNQRAASLTQHLASIDVLDAERDLRKSKVDEVDDGDENQQNGNSSQRDGNGFVGACNIGSYIPFEVSFVYLGNPESVAVFGPGFFIG